MARAPRSKGAKPVADSFDVEVAGRRAAAQRDRFQKAIEEVAMALALYERLFPDPDVFRIVIEAGVKTGRRLLAERGV